MKIMWQDVVVMLGFCLAFGAGFASQFIITEISTLTVVAEFLEASPIGRTALNLGYSIFVVQICGVAFLMGVYYFLRRNWLRSGSEVDWQTLSFYSIALFLVFFQNFLNDLPIALKVLLTR